MFMVKDGIAVLDFGGQYAHLIAAKLRELKVFAELKDSTTPAKRLAEYKGVILSGSPSLASKNEGIDYDAELFDLKIPLLGLCFGHQEIAKHYGGKVAHTGKEYGPAVFYKTTETPLFNDLAGEEQVWMSHMDSVVEVPPGFMELGYTVSGDGKTHRNSAIGSNALRRYGFQFHPEVDDTVHGKEMLEAFAKEICGCGESWTMEDYIDRITAEIREKTDGKQVLLLVSGGVDSTVCAWLLGRAVGPEKLHLLHIDNGLMRMNESREVVKWFQDNDVSRNIHFVDASNEFIRSLEGVVDPEKKRGSIGNTFIDVLEREAEKLDLRNFVMAQGTIYPDTVETGGTRRSTVIKTHHNRVPVVEKMLAAGKMIEPLAELYKNEVRELGKKLGIVDQALERHPFPGPGLGVRVLASRLDIPKTHTEDMESRVEKAARNAGFRGWLMPIRSVGVKADLRSYEQPVMLWSESFEWEKARQLVVDMVNDIPGINRGVLLWGKDPGNVSLTCFGAEVTRKRLEVLRKADEEVKNALEQSGSWKNIWQCPVILVPIGIEGRREELLVIRPVYSQRAMTASPAPIENEVLEKIWSRVSQIGCVWGMALDVTGKPPSTIEWE